MAKNHPDDFMSVTISIDFDAKANPMNPDTEKMIPLSMQFTLPANEISEDLQDILDAIEERRLYGFVCQRCAQMNIEVGEWVEKSFADKVAEATKDD